MSNLLDMTVGPWEGSVLVLENAGGTSAVAQSLSDKILILFAVLCLTLLMLFFKRYVEGVKSAAQVFVSYNRALEVFDSKRDISSMYVAFFLSVPLYALSLARLGFSALEEWWILLDIVIFFVFRHIVYEITGWLTARQESFRILENTSTGYFVLIMLVSILGTVAAEIFSPDEKHSVAIFLLIVYITGISVYFSRSYKIFNLSGFSIIFWFLYLCSLEILPMCVAGNVLLSNGH